MVAIAFQEWLDSGQEYEAGVALYAQHPEGRPALLRLLQSAGPGAFTCAKLAEEAARLAQLVLPYVSAGPEKRNEKVAEMPDDVAELHREKGELFKEAMHHRAQLPLLATREERYAAALLIKQNFQRIDKIWSDLNYRQKYGQLPVAVVPAVSADDAGGQRKRLTTLRTYISSKRGTPEKRASWQAEIAELERLLSE